MSGAVDTSAYRALVVNSDPSRPLPRAVQTLCDEVDRLRASLDRVRALHSGGEYGSVDRHLCQDVMVTAEECETIRAIAGPAAPAPQPQETP